MDKKYSIFNNNTVKAGTLYSASSIAKSVAGMVSGLAMLKWLNPSEIGMWQALIIIQAYLPFTQLGIQSGLSRELPILLGRSEFSKAHLLISTAKAYAILLCGIFLLITVLTSVLLILIGKPASLVLGILTIGLISICFSYNNHLSVTFRSTQSFTQLSFVNFTYAFIALGLLVLIYKYNYYGVLMYSTLLNLIQVTLTHRFRPFKDIKPHFRQFEFSRLLKTGMVLMSLNQIRSAAVSIPKILILKLKGVTSLGLYSPALAVNSMFTILPTAIAQFFHPQIGYKYGQTGNARDLWNPTKKLFWALIIVSIPISLIIWVVTPYVLQNFFPKYIDSLWPMRIMSVAFIFSSAYTTHGVLYSIKAYKFAFIYTLTELLGYILFPLLFIAKGGNFLVDITLGILLNNLVLSVMNYLLLNHVLHLPAFNQKQV